MTIANDALRRPRSRRLPRLTLPLLLLVGTLAGCASREPPPLLLALPPLAAPTIPVATPPATLPAPRPVLVVRRVEIPEYLMTRRVRYRQDASSVAEWPNTYWAERIEIGMTREFAAALRPALPGWTVCEAICPDHAPDLSLRLELAPLDFLRSSRRLRAGVRATVMTEGGSPRTLHSSEEVLEVAATEDSPQAHARALSELLQAIAQSAAPTLDAATGVRSSLAPSRPAAQLPAGG